jgi:uncharacterized membrane protein
MRTPLHAHAAQLPFVLWIVSFLFDIASVWGGPPMVEAALFNVCAGLIAAILVAATGLWDYLRRLQPRSTSRQLARWHAAAHTLSMLLFAVSLYLRWTMRGAWATPRWPFVLSALGVALMGLGSYVGGLVEYPRFTTPPRSSNVR